MDKFIRDIKLAELADIELSESANTLKSKINKIFDKVYQKDRSFYDIDNDIQLKIFSDDSCQLYLDTEFANSLMSLYGDLYSHPINNFVDFLKSIIEYQLGFKIIDVQLINRYILGGGTNISYSSSKTIRLRKNNI